MCRFCKGNSADIFKWSKLPIIINTSNNLEISISCGVLYTQPLPLKNHAKIWEEYKNFHIMDVVNLVIFLGKLNSHILSFNNIK